MKALILALVTLASVYSSANVLLCGTKSVGLDEETLKMKIVFKSAGTNFVREGFAMKSVRQTPKSKSESYVLPTGEIINKTWKSDAGDDFEYTFKESSTSHNSTVCTVK
ncbi:MAG: hypothetical protein WA160_14845 [Pseudobdellovibrio sp.]